MTAQEELMDELERNLTKVIQQSRHRMYQRMSAEKPAPDAKQTELKYLLRYYDMDSNLRSKVIKPQPNVSVIETATGFVNQYGYGTSFWVYDGKQNLIYSQV